MGVKRFSMKNALTAAIIASLLLFSTIAAAKPKAEQAEAEAEAAAEQAEAEAEAAAEQAEAEAEAAAEQAEAEAEAVEGSQDKP